MSGVGVGIQEKGVPEKRRNPEVGAMQLVKLVKLTCNSGFFTVDQSGGGTENPESV